MRRRVAPATTLHLSTPCVACGCSDAHAAAPVRIRRQALQQNEGLLSKLQAVRELAAFLKVNLPLSKRFGLCLDCSPPAKGAWLASELESAASTSSILEAVTVMVDAGERTSRTLSLVWLLRLLRVLRRRGVCTLRVSELGVTMTLRRKKKVPT